MDDVLESPESDQAGQGKNYKFWILNLIYLHYTDLNAHGQAGSGIMKDWILVAAGIERFFFLIYTIAFALVTSVYV